MIICALPHRRWFPRWEVSPTLARGRDAVDLPLRWKSAAHVFLLPGDDLLARPFSAVEEVLGTIRATPRHEYQLVTSRPNVAEAFVAQHGWAENAWLGLAVQSPADAGLIPAFRRVPVPVRFLHLRGVAGVHARDLEGWSFVIFEGAAGAAEPLKERCESAGVRLFVGNEPERAQLVAGPTTAIVPVGPRPRLGVL